MNTKEDFIVYLRMAAIEMDKSSAETNSTTQGFLDGLARWLEDSKETGPENFNWEFASNIIRAGIYYE
jgi:hypothetical protein